MSALYWSLIVIAAALMCLLFMLIVIERRRKRQSYQAGHETRARPAGKRDVFEDDLDDFDDTPAIGQDIRPHTIVKQASSYEGTIDILRAKYNSVKKILKIPTDAVLVWRKIDIFCMKRCDILHYCWCSSANLYFFPKWESIEAKLVTGAVTRYIDGDENNFATVTIPKSSIEQWLLMPDDKVGLLYKRKRNKRIILRMDNTVLPVLEKYLPEKEHSYVMKYAYPKSPQNIFDIKGEFVKLKEHRIKTGMGDEEFERRKMHIILTK